MNARLFISIFTPILISGCYYGPGVSRVETNAIRRSVRDVNPAPIISQQSNSLGQNLIAPALDSTLTPFILGEESYEDPKVRTLRKYDENMMKQQRAMDQMDEELKEIRRNQQ